MATKHHITEVTQEVVADLAQNGMADLHVDVDEKMIAYLSGAVASQQAEADAVAVVLRHDVKQVQDGLAHPGHLTPKLPHSGAICPETHHHVASQDPVQRMLGAAHLESRVFDGSASESTLQTGTPLTTRGKV